MSEEIIPLLICELVGWMKICCIIQSSIPLLYAGTLQAYNVISPGLLVR